MRVVLYYDLLRFSPCSIDLFISMNISPPQSTTLTNKSTCLRCAQGLFLSLMVHVFFGTSILLDTIFLLCGEFAKKRQVRRWCYCVEKYGIWNMEYGWGSSAVE